jgi:hypothetical protein
MINPCSAIGLLSVFSTMILVDLCLLLFFAFAWVCALALFLWLLNFAPQGGFRSTHALLPWLSASGEVLDLKPID